MEVKNKDGALKFLREHLEDAGIFVMSNGKVANNTSRLLNPDEFKGFVLIDEMAPVIFLNAADWQASQIFTLAHEVAHVFLGKSAAFNFDRMLAPNEALELYCNKLGAEVLISKAIFDSDWGALAGSLKDKAAKLSKRYKVSQLVVSRRALENGLVSKDQFFDFYKEEMRQYHANKLKNKSMMGNFYNSQNNRIGKGFTSLINVAVSEGTVSYLDAYRLTDLYGKTFDQTFSNMGIV